MRKILTLFLLSLVYASFSSIYTIDEEALNMEFKELNKIEEEILNSDFNVEIMDQIKQNSIIPILASQPISYDQSQSFYMDWGSFAWGFCCCPVGFFVVAVNRNTDDDMKYSYWIGVGASIAINLISSAAYYSSAGSCYY